jgi:hypothetical protein
VPRHVARLVTRLVAPLAVDYSASRRLIVDYFAYAARPGASARRAARRAARHRLFRVARLVTRLVVPLVMDYPASRRLVVDYSALHRLVVDYYAFAVRPVASARHADRRVAHRRLLRLRRASGCLGTSRGSSLGSSSTTSPTPRVRVPRHVARLVVDYFDYAARSGVSARRAARLAACCRQLRLRRASGFLGTSRGSSRGSSSTTSPSLRVRVARPVARLVVDYFDYAARSGASARRAARLAACCRQLRLLRLHCASG